MATISGTGANDTFLGTSGDDKFVLSQGGEDTVSGLDGNDIFQFGATLDAGDRVDGGTGNDIVQLRGDYSAGLVLADSTLANIGKIQFGGAFNYSLTGADGNIVAGRAMTLDASALAAPYHLSFNGAAESDGRFVFFDGAGNDMLIGGARTDTFTLDKGGEDTISGGAANDVVHATGTLDAGDSLDGGAGSGDKLEVNGLAGGDSIVFGATTVVNFESLVLDAGHGYSITTDDATVFAHHTLTVTATALAAGENLVFDGSAETDGTFVIHAGAGDDVITGGAKADTIDLSAGGEDTVHAGGGNDVIQMGATFDAGDSIDGGDGKNTLVLAGLQAPVVMGATTLVDIQSISLRPGYDYDLTMNDDAVPLAAVMAINASQVGVGNVFRFDGSAELDGRFSFKTGFGEYHIVGGARTDVFNLGATFTDQDSIDGGSSAGHTHIKTDHGINHVILSGEYTGATALDLSVGAMTDIQVVALGAGHSYDISAVDGAFGPASCGFPVTFTCYTFADGDNFTLDDSAESFLIDRVFMGNANGTYNIRFGAADDLMYSGGVFTAADTLDGGAGNDSLVLDGDFLHPDLNANFTGANALVLGAGQLTSVEDLALVGGYSYDITTNDGNVAAGATLTIEADGSSAKAGGGDMIVLPGLGGTDTLTFDGAAETDGMFVFECGGGTCTLTGGQQADTFLFAGNFSAADTIDGQGGADTLSLAGDYSGGLTLGGTVTGVETVRLGAGHSYAIAVSGDISGSAAAFDASALGASDTLTLDLTAATSSGYTVTGGAGDDTVSFAGNYSAAFVIAGGAGHDTLSLDGDYSGLALDGATLSGIEAIALGGGHAYTGMTLGSDFGAGVTLDATALGDGDTLSLDASALTDALTFEAGGGTYDITGGAGGDTFILGTDFTASDALDGGAGNDTLAVAGNYGDFGGSAPFVLGGTLTSIETLAFASGTAQSDDILTDDSLVGAGQTLTVDASAATAGSTIAFDGSAETDGAFHFIAGGGSFSATGGAGDDVFDGGAQSLIEHGGGGDDVFNLGPYLNVGFTIDGGAGNDTVTIDGNYSAGFAFGATTMVNVENLVLVGGDSYILATSDGTVAAGATLTVDATALGAGDSLAFDGSNETDGSFVFETGLGTCTLTGGNCADVFTLGAGAVTLAYNTAEESTGDVATGFDASRDFFHFAAVTVTGVDAVSGDASAATLGADIDAVIAGTTNNAIVFTATGGDEAGNAFILIDANGDHAYTAGTDYLVQLTAPTHMDALGIGSFI
ncbi:MAG: beta strand repeat-containing protein [Rhizomicrobium sp.]